LQTWANGNVDTNNISPTAAITLAQHAAGFVQLAPVRPAGSATAAVGQLVVAQPSATITMPTAVLGAVCEVYADGSPTGATPVTVVRAGGSTFYGAGLSGATSFLLGAPGAYALLACHDAANWVVVGGQQDTGWVALTLGTGWGVYTGNTPYGRVIGDRVWLKGLIINNSGGPSSSPFAAFPAVLRPSATAVMLPPVDQAVSTILTLVSNGTSSGSANWASNAVVVLSGVSYLLAGG
jgi:hypothetical protein